VNLSRALVQIASSLHPLFPSWCLQGELAMPIECVVSEIVGDLEYLLRPCDEGGGVPCYRLIEDAAQCPDTPSGLRVEIDRDGALPPDAATISVRCLVEA
jgi:hypothetical protein